MARNVLPRLVGALLFPGALALGPGCTQEGASDEKAPSAEASAPDAAAGGVELPPGTGPVAVVNGTEIPRDAFNRAYVQTLERYRRARHEVKPELRERLKDNIVRRLVDQELIAQQARALGVTLDPVELERKWAEHKKRYGSNEAFQAFLERAGTSAEDVRESFENNHLREAVFARIAESVSVSGEEVRAFFEENRARYDEPEMIRASHILIRVPPDATDEVVKERLALARKVRRLASKKGADFAALAEQYGEDPTNKRGGDLGFFPKGRMVKAFEEAAWGLRKGRVSKVVKTQFGFHVIKKTDYREASTKKLEEVFPAIERGLLARKRNAAIREALEAWKEKADIEILLKGDPAIINAAYDKPAGSGDPIFSPEDAPAEGDPTAPGADPQGPSGPAPSTPPE